MRPAFRRGVLRRLSLGEGRGVAALEFALLAPFLILVTVGIVDVVYIIHDRMALSQSLTAGAQYAFRQGQSETGTTLDTDVTNFVNTISPVTLTSLSVVFNGGDNTSTNYYCVAGATPAYTQSSSGATCADGSTAGQFVAISATVTPTPFFGMDEYLMPGVLSSSVTVRLK
jgi:Flp pilus assembly protein TadG